MLIELKIRNLALIESVDISFGPGLNVLTGETGAGKSILLDALNIALGGRCERDMVRSGSEEAWVEAVFEIDNQVIPTAREWGIELVTTEPVALRRVIYANGRSRAYINCMMIPANLLRQMASLLLDFGRQNEQSMLTTTAKHLELLDRYANAQEERAAVAKMHQHVLALVKEYEGLTAQTRVRAEKFEFLNYQRDIITKVAPQKGEEAELTAELERLSKAKKCQELAKRLEHDMSNRQNSIRDQFSNSIRILEDLARLDDSVQHVLEDLHNALIAVEEAGRSMQVYQKSLYVDAEQMEEIRKRLDQIIKLQQKHGGSFEGVIKRMQEIDRELEDLAKQEKRCEQLNESIDDARSELQKLALLLSDKRHKAAQELIPKVEKELAGLAMNHARFQINFSLLDVADANCVTGLDAQGTSYAIGSLGMENVNFLFSANPGEEPRPIERVASGGELSRIMLALKKVMVSAFPVDTFVVDEIDAGVAGTTAATVAQKLREIVANTHSTSQIISISHTPQIAAEADYHFCVEKQNKRGRTVTQVTAMNYQERLAEISRMLGGDQTSEQTLALAKELLSKSVTTKQ